jgi:hypothetical protein
MTLQNNILTKIQAQFDIVEVIKTIKNVNFMSVMILQDY